MTNPAKKFKERVLSGIQPSGRLHVGNYLGMLKNAVALQTEYDELYYAIVDLHSLSQDFDAKQKHQQILELALDMLAIGIDPKKSAVFQQSDVLEHANLAIILNNFTYMGELERMTQYKDKVLRQEKNINVGLFDYPVLMAADILIYKATHVPVGEDQTQHIELARDLARRFNHKFGETFPVPKALYTQAPRVMSILDPEQKMSKSLGDAHCIYMSDEPDIIRKKLSKAVTATGAPRGEMPAGVKNLFLMLKHFDTADEYARFEREYQEASIKYQELKEALSEAISQFFEPFREKRKQLAKNLPAVEAILKEGAEKARSTASETLNEIKAKLGLN